MLNQEGLNRAPDQRIDPKLQQFITLDDISVTMRKVLAELTAERDEGGKWFYSGTATTEITIIDLLKTPPQHEIKGFSISNDSTDDIYFNHNDMYNSNMNKVRENETLPVNYNRKVISKIFLKTLSGSSNYRLAVYW